MKDRWKVVQKMDLTTQYSFAGDYTGKPSPVVTPDAGSLTMSIVEAIEKSVHEIAKFDAGTAVCEFPVALPLVR